MQEKGEGGEIEGKVDWKGRPAIKGKHGGQHISLHVLGNKTLISIYHTHACNISCARPCAWIAKWVRSMFYKLVDQVQLIEPKLQYGCGYWLGSTKIAYL